MTWGTPASEWNQPISLSWSFVLRFLRHPIGGTRAAIRWRTERRSLGLDWSPTLVGAALISAVIGLAVTFGPQFIRASGLELIWVLLAATSALAWASSSVVRGVLGARSASPRSRSLVGQARSVNGTRAARTLLEEGLRAEPRDPLLRWASGNLFLEDGDYDSAQAEFETAADLSGLGLGLGELAETAYRAGNLDAAASIAKLATWRLPDDPIHWRIRGAIALHRRSYDRAAECFAYSAEHLDDPASESWRRAAEEARDAPSTDRLRRAMETHRVAIVGEIFAQNREPTRTSVDLRAMKLTSNRYRMRVFDSLFFGFVALELLIVGVALRMNIAASPDGYLAGLLVSEEWIERNPGLAQLFLLIEVGVFVEILLGLGVVAILVSSYSLPFLAIGYGVFRCVRVALRRRRRLALVWLLPITAIAAACSAYISDAVRIVLD